ncbi:MAG TPA: DUF4012 domain-containing protein, partial [Acidimicrobiales bacterium]|nr:DUF4012 domain-containing protein [Acidimicrobiales bacterium]
PCLVSGYRQLPRRPRRWLGWATLGAAVVAVVVAVPVAVAALMAHARVSQGIVAAEGALGSTSSGRASSAAAQRLITAQLHTANADFTSAASRTGAWWTAGGRLIPVVAQQRQALARATAVAGDVTSVAEHEAAGIHLGQITYQHGRIDLAKVGALRGSLGTVDGHLATAERQLGALKSAWLVSPVQSRLGVLDAEVTKAHAGADLAAQVLDAVPSLLGGHGARHYFVAFMTPAESRGLGGFIGAYGELTADQGRITLSRAGAVGQLNEVPTGSRHITGQADYLARYGGFRPADYFQNLTFSPDMPTVTQVVAQMYPQSGGDHIDGMLALDPQALASLLDFTGPLEVPGLGELTAANAADVLLKGQYASFPAGGQQGARHDYLQDALRQAFAKLTSGTLPAPQALAEALDPDVRQGRLLLWSLHPADQPMLRRVGLAGAFPSARGGDLLAVTTQNAANNKIDAYLQRSVTDHVAYDPASGQVDTTVSVALHNEAPSSGLSRDVIGSFPGSGLAPGTNMAWFSLYSALRLTGARQGASPLPMVATPELGVHAYSAYVAVPAGATVTLTFELQGRTQPGREYRLVLDQQPLVLADKDRVEVSGAGGWSPNGAANWIPGTDARQRHAFSFRTGR